jgi:hypothetical protein
MSVISSKNKIYARPADGGNYKQIGVVATFSPTESRTIEPVRGIGFGDHVAELVPGATEPMSIAVTRTAQYISMIYQVFGYKGGIDGIVRSLRHHKWPFDIQQQLIISRLPHVEKEVGEVTGDDNPGLVASGDTFDETLMGLVTYYEGCWLSDYSTSFAADTALVQEDVTIMVTDIVASSGLDYTETDLRYFSKDAMSSILTDIAAGVPETTGG